MGLIIPLSGTRHIEIPDNEPDWIKRLIRKPDELRFVGGSVKMVFHLSKNETKVFIRNYQRKGKRGIYDYISKYLGVPPHIAYAPENDILLVTWSPASLETPYDEWK